MYKEFFGFVEECGVLYDDYSYVRLHNSSRSPYESFIISEEEWRSVKNKKRVIGFIHTHTDRVNHECDKPSSTDLKLASKKYDTNILISIPTGDIVFYNKAGVIRKERVAIPNKYQAVIKTYEVFRKAEKFLDGGNDLSFISDKVIDFFIKASNAMMGQLRDRSIRGNGNKEKRQGRPEKINDEECIKRLMFALGIGMSHTASCAYAGMAQAVFYSYIQKGEIDRENGKISAYSEFSEKVERVKAECQARLVSRIIDHIQREPDDIDTVFKFLEKRYPDSWGQRQQIDVNTKSVGVEVRLTTQEEERLKRELGFISKKSLPEPSVPRAVDSDKSPQDS